MSEHRSERQPAKSAAAMSEHRSSLNAHADLRIEALS
jgi:hypothetical protein